MARPSHLLFATVALSVSLAPATGCHKREICGGSGMVVDSRPLAGVLAEIGTPHGSTICKSSSSNDDKSAETHRLVEVGKNAGEGYELWKRQLEGKGWKEATPMAVMTSNLEIETSAVAGKQRSDCEAKHEFTKAGVPGRFSLVVSYCGDVWKEVGWSSVAYLKN